MLDTLTEKYFQEASKNGGDRGTGVYVRQGTTSRVMAVYRPFGQFYDFYSVSPENFGSTHVFTIRRQLKLMSSCILGQNLV